MCVRMVETMLNTMNHGARAKEEQRLEKGVCNQMEKAGYIGARAKCCDHIAELGNRRVGQHPLDVPLCDCNKRCKKSSKGADASHELHTGWRHFTGNEEKWEHPHQQKDTGRDHCRSVNHGTDRSGAFHCVR